MFSAWTKHLKTDEEKERFTNEVKNAKPVLERLTQLLYEDEMVLDRSERSIKAFDLPNWDYRQAYKNGYRAHNEVVNKLVDLDQGK